MYILLQMLQRHGNFVLTFLADNNGVSFWYWFFVLHIHIVNFTICIYIYIFTDILHAYYLLMNASTLRNRFKSIQFSFLFFIAAAS